MKTYLSILYGKYLLALTLLLSISPVKAQSPFRARYQQDRVQPISAVVTSVDTIELSGYGTIYALSVDATVEQPREGSFVRVVLEDSEGHDHLVLESDRFRNDSAIVHFSQHSQETSMLSGITPVRLKCYATGDAVLNLTAVNASTQRPLRNVATPETQRAVRREQAQEVVNRINAYNEAHHKLWRAGITNRVLYAYDNDEDKGLTNSYIANFKYYTDGIYEMGERPTNRTGNTYQSPYVSSFDWRNRHGKNWITRVKNQGATGNCAMFATVGMLEARTNLHFNDSSINLNLSEQCLLNYVTPPNYIYDIATQLSYICEYGIIDSLSLPYCGVSHPNEPRPEGIECVFHQGSLMLTKGNDYNHFEDTIKHSLLHNGPGVWGFNYPNGHHEIVYDWPNYYHNMTLVGYGTITATDTITLVGQSIYTPFLLTSDSINLVGETYWIFKDSYGGYSDSTYHHNGYRYVLFHDESCVHEKAFFIDGSIIRRDHTDAEIICEDADGDGYFCWGLGYTPTNLPAWAEQDEDSDDSNDSIGPINEYGHMEELTYGLHSSESIDVVDGQIDLTSDFIRTYIEVPCNATYTIKGTKVFHPNGYLETSSNSTVIVDGGKLVDPNFSFENNCTIILKNGGEIIYTKYKPNFTLPLGLTLRIEKGGIRYDRDFR